MTMQFALLNAPGVYDVDNKLMGRQSAGAGFLRAALEARPDRIWCYAASRAVAEKFGRLVLSLTQHPPEMRHVDWLQPDRLALAGTLFRPDPGIDKHAWHRQAVGEARGFSVCGITHTLSSEAVYGAIAQLQRAPLYPWDALICTSKVAKDVVRRIFDDEGDHLCARFGAKRIPEPQLVTIPLGVHCKDFSFSESFRQRSRGSLGIADSEVVVLFAGRLVFHAKAHPMPMFLGLERAAKRTGQSIRLLLFGQFPNEGVAKAFKDEAKQFAPSVTMTVVDGAVPENRDLVWSAADIFTSFSDNVQETFGLTPVEAMAAGLPVVVSDWNGYKDTVRDGVDGFRVPTWAMPTGTGADIADRYDMQIDHFDKYVGVLSQFTAVNVEAASEAFQKLIASPDLRRQMGEAGRQRALTVFDWSVVFKQYLALWDEMAALRRSSPLQPGEDRTTRRPDRPDPSSLFASFATHQPDDATRITLDARGAGVSLAELRALASTSFAAAVLPSVAAMAAVLESVRSRGELSLGDLVVAHPQQPRSTVIRSVLWLTKMGVIAMRTNDTV